VQFGSLRLCHGLNLAQDTLGQILDSNAAAGGLGGKILCVDLVEGGKVGDIGQEAGGLDDLVVAGTGGFQDRTHVLAALLGLGSDALGHSAVRGVHRDLAGGVDETACDEALGVGADRAGSFFSSDDFHGKYLLSVCLMELLSSGRKILLLEVYTMRRDVSIIK